jgi:NAD(P)-dependent dehydrogenase (short-subunit alcohol dehydrogenase family)
MLGLVRAAALAHAKQNVRINAVLPGAVDTPMFDRFTGNSDAYKGAMRSAHPIGRSASPDEIARVVLFLYSDASSFVLAQGVLADGGYTAQ